MGGTAGAGAARPGQGPGRPRRRARGSRPPSARRPPRRPPPSAWRACDWAARRGVLLPALPREVSSGQLGSPRGGGRRGPGAAAWGLGESQERIAAFPFLRLDRLPAPLLVIPVACSALGGSCRPAGMLCPQLPTVPQFVPMQNGGGDSRVPLGRDWRRRCFGVSPGEGVWSPREPPPCVVGSGPLCTALLTIPHWCGWTCL